MKAQTRSFHGEVMQSMEDLEFLVLGPLEVPGLRRVPELPGFVRYVTDRAKWHC